MIVKVLGKWSKDSARLRPEIRTIEYNIITYIAMIVLKIVFVSFVLCAVIIFLNCRILEYFYFE